MDLLSVVGFVGIFGLAALFCLWLFGGMRG
jgi:hypothetical protein